LSIDLVQQTVARGRFAEQLHSTFSIDFGDAARVPAELVEYTERSMTPQNEQFSLLFRVAADVPAAQGMREVTHPALGTLALFLVPVDRDGRGLYLEAAFNRLIPPAGDGGENP